MWVGGGVGGIQTTTLNPLSTQTICWWAAERKANERLALEQQIKPAKIHAMEIDTGHFDIVRAESLLSAVKLLLTTPLTDRVYS
jgi:hypothetical protein